MTKHKIKSIHCAHCGIRLKVSQLLTHDCGLPPPVFPPEGGPPEKRPPLVTEEEGPRAVIQTCMGCGKNVDTQKEANGLDWWTEEGDSGVDWYHNQCFEKKLGGEG